MTLAPIVFQEKTLPDFIQGQGKRAGRSRFLTAPQRDDLSYETLADFCTRIEVRLRELGMSRTDRVALILGNGPDAATAFLAVASAATVVPLNPAFKKSELTTLLHDMDAALVVTDEPDHTVVSLAEEMGIRIAFLEANEVAGDFNLEIDGPAPTQAPFDLQARPEDTALLLYTSGTTSKPKSVPLSHENLLFGAAFSARALDLSRDDLCLNVMPLYHAHGITSTILTSLLHGSGVITTSGFAVETFFDILADNAPTWFSGVPAMHAAICAAVKAEPGRMPDHDLRFVRSASSSMPVEILDTIHSVFGCPVVEAYGMSEATSMVSANPLQPGSARPGSVGVSTGCEITILDPEGQSVTAGEEGEIALSGPNIFSGYGNAPDATRAAFKDGWFRTGDWGYLDRDGFLYISGRTKELINRGGSKIIPNEIDKALRSHSAVKEAAAFGLPHPTLGEDVAAAVVVHQGQLPTTLELRQHVADQIADFKIPSRITIVEALPKTATGKVRRVALAENMRASFAEADQPLARELGSERDVIDLWEGVLGTRPSRSANFFDLGGTSILLSQLFEKFRERWGKPQSVIELIDCPTPASQAVMLSASVPTGLTSPIESQSRPSGRLGQRLAALKAAGGSDAEG